MTVPKLRFKEFDGGWTKSTIQFFMDNNFILDQMDGNHGELYPKSEEFSATGVPYISATDFSFGDVNFATCKRLPIERAKLFKKGIAKNGDVLFAHNATVGPVAILKTDLDFVILSTTATYYRCEATYLNNHYLKNYFESDFFVQQYFGIMSQSTRNQVPITTQRKLNIAVPNIQEQTKIASFLSAVDEKISQLTQKHQLLSQYKQGMMQKLFSQQVRFKADDGSEFGEWEKTKFLDLMVDLWDYRGKTPKKLGMDWGDGEIQSLSALNIKKGFIDFDADCHLGSEKLYKTWMNKGDLEKDDIIFTMEAPLGNVALIPDDRKYILSQRVVCFKTNKKMVDNKFIFQLILSDQFQNRIEELATGTTAKGINQKSMQKIEVALPPKDEQTKIANFLSVIEQKIEVVAQQIEQAKTWKKGLLQQMFV